MSWFKKNKIDKDMIKMIQPTSKAALKSQCLLLSHGDIDKAEKLYDFYAKDMEDMPMFDAPTPTWVDNTKKTLDGFFSFLGEHKDGLAQTWDVIRAILSKRGINLPALGGSIAEASADAAASIPTLPPINE